jgi:hypothetical protein
MLCMSNENLINKQLLQAIREIFKNPIYTLLLISQDPYPVK